MNTLHTLGITFRTASIDLRDRVSFVGDAALRFRERLAAAGVAQSLVLSTCNRCEVVVFGDEAALAVGEGEFCRNFAIPHLAEAMTVRSGDDALIYLMRLASGLESMVFGEYQILGQFKSAYTEALASGHVAGEFDRLLRSVITVAKKVRTELDLGAVSPSVCRAGVELVNERFGFAGKRALIIGSGRTGTLAAKLAKRFGAAEICVANRNPGRVRQLVAEIGAKPIDYTKRYEAVALADIVISATASPHVVLEAERVKLDHSTVFLDLASPRDVGAKLAANPLASLLNLDNIGILAAGDRQERERLTAAAMTIIRRSLPKISERRLISPNE